MTILLYSIAAAFNLGTAVYAHKRGDRIWSAALGGTGMVCAGYVLGTFVGSL